MSFLKFSIITMRSDFRFEFCSIRCDGISRTCYGGKIGFWWCQVTLVCVAYVFIASSYLIISSATCPCYLLELVLLVILVVSELLRVQLSLWSCDSEILWSWDPECVEAPGSPAASGSLRFWCDQAPRMLGSWDSWILWSWACWSTWEWSFFWVLWDWLWS